MGNFSIVSFFCGCGGLDLGFKGGFEYKLRQFPKLPFDILQAYDFDKKCIETYRANIDQHASVKDLANFDIEDIPCADVLIGGFPCQDFATCGPRRGLESDRGKLYLAQVDYMTRYQPKVVIAENVPGLANLDNGNALRQILKDFESCGYIFKVWNLFAPEYGIPQNRTRLFLIGVRNDIKGFPTPPEKSHFDTYNPIEWAIGDLINIDDESIPNQSQYFKASRAKKGNGQGDETSKRGQPSYTVRANAKSRVQFHYHLDRRLTIRECARLQTFPDSFTFPHSATTNIMQIGNAVPPVLAHQVAGSIAYFLNGLENGTEDRRHYSNTQNTENAW